MGYGLMAAGLSSGAQVPRRHGPHAPQKRQNERAGQNPQEKYEKDQASNPQRKEKQDPQYDPSHSQQNPKR
jgi:hypothetical protein